MDDPNRSERAEALIESARYRLEEARATERGIRQRKQRSAGSGPRLRTMLLSAFAIALFLLLGSGNGIFGGKSGAPLVVYAEFTPAQGGVSYAGPRVFDGSVALAEGDVVRLAPGDIVGAQGGSGATMTLGAGTVELEPGARILAASFMPPRARLIGGGVTVQGKLRLVTAHGIVDVDEGSADIVLDGEGLSVTVREGRVTVTSAEGVDELGPRETLKLR